MTRELLVEFNSEIKNMLGLKEMNFEALETLIIPEKKEHQKFPRKILELPKTIHHNAEKKSESNYLI